MDAGRLDDSVVLDSLFSDSPLGLYVLDSEQRVVRYRPGRGVRELPAEDIVGHSVEEFARGFAPDELRILIGEVLSTGKPVRGHLVRGHAPSEPRRTLTVEVSLFPLRAGGDRVGGLVAVVEDVTDRQAADDRLALLGTVYESVGSTLDPRTTAGELAEALVPEFADAAAVDLMDNPPGTSLPAPGQVPADTPLRRSAFAPAASPATIRTDGESTAFPFPSPYTQALNDAQPRLLAVADDSPWLASAPGTFAPLRTAGIHSMIVVPLVAREQVLGLLTVYRNRPDPFVGADLEVARQVGFTASVHLANAYSYQREHTVASTLQRRLQPGTVPELTAVETAHVYLPESAGGDWFDVVPLSGARVALVVGAVEGHGIDAAATMGQLRVALRALAMQDLETDELLTHLDEVASLLTDRPSGGPAAGGSSSGNVASCAIAVYDPVSRHCSLVRAGHPAPVLLDPDGSPLPVEVPAGPALGEGGSRAYLPAAVRLPAGSLLALYSPGLLAAHHDGPDARSRLEHVLASTAQPLQELCDAAVYHLAPSRDEDAVLLLARTRALPEDQVADWTLPSDPSVVATARRLVEQQLRAWQLDETVFTTKLIVSELVTNAVRYGRGPIRLRLIHDLGRLLSEVTDANSASPHLRQARDTDEGGRGLHIVTQLCSRWGVRHSPKDKTIWAEQLL
ncbi:SpoIIE family protein phosphatase [Streptomyces poriticola]|uniref:SpoIIE family protein phosphatase n=1 Tax=Streptomyces poriticola TaxID=3120506 RepID=UPI002FCE3344